MLTPALSHAAGRLFAARRARDEIFGDDRNGFGEPAWDMLLMLASVDMAGDAVAHDVLVQSASVSASVASTYVDWLLSRELVIRDISQPSQPCAGYRLSDCGRERLAAYLERAGRDTDAMSRKVAPSES